MTTQALRSSDYLHMVDPEKGLVDRKMFSDQEIYEAELKKIFARAWNFMAHESQIPNPGDFFQTFIGEDRVIVVRDRGGRPQVLLNTCRHRGNAVCRAEEGHATSFMCTYHGWTYDLEGKLVGVPGFKDYYHEDLKREEWGLVQAALVDSYKGFIFASLDPEAPDFQDYLGDVGRLCIDVIAERGEDLVVVGGVQKYVINCNWKFAADNTWDFYHGQLTHASSLLAGWPRPGINWGIPTPNMIFLGEYGHVLGGPENTPDQRGNTPRPQGWRERPEARRVLGPLADRIPTSHPHIFPNFWVANPAIGQVSMRMPRGPLSTEIWWFTFVDRAAPADHAGQIRNAIHTFGPAGMLEQEDGENWGQSTVATLGTVGRGYPLNYSMHVGKGEIVEDELSPPRIETTSVTEHPQLWHYRNWAHWMAADGWGDLRANHPLPQGKV